jgi:hypothetical protein
VQSVVSSDEGKWVVSACGPSSGICPDCRHQSRSRHGWSYRSLQDLPIQGNAVTLRLQLSRWRCTYRQYRRQTFTDQIPSIASPYARRTSRVAEVVSLFGHSMGARPGERLMQRLGMPISDETILRHPGANVRPLAPHGRFDPHQGEEARPEQCPIPIGVKAQRRLRAPSSALSGKVNRPESSIPDTASTHLRSIS